MSRSGKYADRPGASPVTASLYAAGVIKPKDRVLDVGCGTGSDCLALVNWGIAGVAGIDDDEQQIATARRRARAFGLPPEMFHHAAARDLADEFDDGTFTVVLDTLCWNNMSLDAPRDTPRYVCGAWRVLRKGGLFVVVHRQEQRWLATGKGGQALPRSFNKYFVWGPVVVTHIPEHPAHKRLRPYATVAITVGRRRARPRTKQST